METSGVERKLSHGKEAQLELQLLPYFLLHFCRWSEGLNDSVCPILLAFLGTLSIGELQLAASMGLPQKMSVVCLEALNWRYSASYWSFLSILSLLFAIYLVNYSFWTESTATIDYSLNGKFPSDFSSLHSHLCMSLHVSACLCMSLDVSECLSMSLHISICLCMS